MLSRPCFCFWHWFCRSPTFSVLEIVQRWCPRHLFYKIFLLFFCSLDSNLISSIPNFSSFLLQGITDTHIHRCVFVFASRFACCNQALVFKSHVSTLRYRLSLRAALGGRLQETDTQGYFQSWIVEVTGRATPGLQRRLKLPSALIVEAALVKKLSSDSAPPAPPPTRPKWNLINGQGLE